VDPPCKEAADAYVSGAVVVDEGTGAVIFTEKTRELYESAFEDVRETCPYDIPRRDPVTGLVSKCTMCIERVQNGLVPACVKACPTGAMNFGGRDEIMTLAGKRLGLLKKKGCDKTQLLDDDVRVVYLLPMTWSCITGLPPRQTM
jgi:formate dehydrogenase iron-sulfur subunit